MFKLMKSIFVLDSALRFDLFMHTDVTQSEVGSFQEVLGLPVFCVGGEVSDGLGEVAPLLNCLAEHLWHQDCEAASMTTTVPSQPGDRKSAV